MMYALSISKDHEIGLNISHPHPLSTTVKLLFRIYIFTSFPMILVFIEKHRNWTAAGVYLHWIERTNETNNQLIETKRKHIVHSHWSISPFSLLSLPSFLPFHTHINSQHWPSFGYLSIHIHSWLKNIFELQLILNSHHHNPIFL